MASPAGTVPTARGLIVRIVILAVWIALMVVSVRSGDPFRITISVIGLVATAATVVLWAAQRRRLRANRENTGDGDSDAPGL